MEKFIIEPLRGFGAIPFGMSLDDAVKVLGAPNSYEELCDMEETGNRSISYDYDDLDTTIIFEGITKSVVAYFETEHPDAILYGTKVFELSRAEVKELMRENNFTKLDEDDEDGEHRISYEDAMIDFFFTGDVMHAITWGVLVDDQGNIIELKVES